MDIGDDWSNRIEWPTRVDFAIAYVGYRLYKPGLHASHVHTTHTAMASLEQPKIAFSNWKYNHYFTLIDIKGKNVYVQCTLCPGTKRLSTSVVSNSNLVKHLTSSHARTKLVATSDYIQLRSFHQRGL